MADIQISLDIETATTIIAYLREMAQDKWRRAEEAAECGGPSQANQITNEFHAVHDCARALETAVNVAAEASTMEAPRELETCDTAAALKHINIAQTVEDLERRVEALENRPANEWPNIDVVRIVAQWAPHPDADVTECIATITDVRDGTIMIDIGDTAIWLPRSQLCAALNEIYSGRA